MAHCKICRGYLSNSERELCDYCSTAKTTVEETIEFLESFLDNPTDSNPINGVWGALEFLNHFLGMYNRYSGLKNLIFEIELNTLMDNTNGTIHVQELANRDAFLKLDIPKQNKLIQAFSEHGIFDIEYPKMTQGNQSSLQPWSWLCYNNRIALPRSCLSNPYISYNEPYGITSGSFFPLLVTVITISLSFFEAKLCKYLRMSCFLSSSKTS